MNIGKSQIAVLPYELRPRTVPDLVRLGRDYDGGYVVDRRSIATTEHLIGLGLDTDWSFERDFRDSNAVPVTVYDGSVGYWLFFRRMIKNCLKKPFKNYIDTQSFAIPTNYFEVAVEYPRFFSGQVQHIKKYVGRNLPPNEISLNLVFENSVPKDATGVFLKMDIEGSEYYILNEIITISKRLSGAVIEFHNVSKKMDTILSFVEQFELDICHIHCNNAAPLNESFIPEIVEISFTRFETKYSNKLCLPNVHDKPNLMNKPDYQIKFQNS